MWILSRPRSLTSMYWLPGETEVRWACETFFGSFSAGGYLMLSTISLSLPSGPTLKDWALPLP